MQNSLFSEGGPHKVKRTGKDNYTFNISLPTDSDGLIERECVSQTCSPAYFKVKLGTGVLGEQSAAYCPYCRHSADPSDFHTKAQVEYGKQIVTREAGEGVERMIKGALGLGTSGRKKIDGGLFSLEISLKPTHKPPIQRPYGEELRRDITCPNCGLEHAVFGIAIWCPDCGTDIFLQHVSKEFDVVKKMLADVDNRRERLGGRVAARDIENALEDTVSIFEAVFRAMTRRRLSENGSSEVEETIRRIGNRFQNLEFAAEIVLAQFGVSLFVSLNENEFDILKSTFQKRHPITHNLGVVDRKYLERTQSGELEGREIRVTAQEISISIDLCLKAIGDIYPKVFPPITPERAINSESNV